MARSAPHALREGSAEIESTAWLHTDIEEEEVTGVHVTRLAMLIWEWSYFHGTNSLRCQAKATSLWKDNIRINLLPRLQIQGRYRCRWHFTGTPLPSVYIENIGFLGSLAMVCTMPLPLVSCGPVDGPPCDDELRRFKIFRRSSQKRVYKTAPVVKSSLKVLLELIFFSKSKNP
jgi:hypothetical protein